MPLTEFEIKKIEKDCLWILWTKDSAAS